MQNKLAIIRAGSESDFKKPTFRCNINVGDMCNFSCSYCINNASKARGRRVLEQDILAGFIEDVAARDFEKYFFGIAGGEPLLYPHLPFMLEKISQEINTDDIKVRFATNGSLLSRTGPKILEATPRIKFQFSISIHLEQIESNLDNYINNILDFGHLDLVKCKILLQPGKLAIARRFATLIESRGMDVILQPVKKVGGEKSSYNEEELDFLLQHPTINVKDIFHDYADGSREELDRISRDLNPEKMNYKDMHCLAGSRTLRLDPGGYVVPCFGAWALPDEKREKWFFNLRERRLRDIPELNRPRICPSTYCSCMTFLKTPKYLAGQNDCFTKEK